MVLLLQLGNQITVLGVHHRQRPQLSAALEGGEHLVVLDHQRAFVGHEMLEGVDAALVDDGLHLVEHLLAPPGDRHVEGVVAMGHRRLVVPHLDGFKQRLTRRWQRKIHDHGCATRKRRAGAGFKIVRPVICTSINIESGAIDGTTQLAVVVPLGRTALAAEVRAAHEAAAIFDLSPMDRVEVAVADAASKKCHFVAGFMAI